MFLFCFAHWCLKEWATVLSQVSRHHNLLQNSNWINLWFHSSWELVVFLHRNFVTLCMLVDLTEAPLKLQGLDCSQVSVQTGTCPPWLTAGVVPPEPRLQGWRPLLCYVAGCWWCLRHCSIWWYRITVFPHTGWREGGANNRLWQGFWTCLGKTAPLKGIYCFCWMLASGE